MKTLTTYINEWKLTSDNNSSVEYNKYNYKPKTKEELQTIIIERLTDNVVNPYLLDIDTSKITDMGELFSGFEGDYLRSKHIDTELIETLDLHTWNTSKVKTMYAMFCHLYGLKNLIIKSFNTRNVRSFNVMFRECRTIEFLDLSSFNISNVTDFGMMFCGCYSLKEIKGIENWNINARSIFSECPKLKLPSWY